MADAILLIENMNTKKKIIDQIVKQLKIQDQWCKISLIQINFNGILDGICQKDRWCQKNKRLGLKCHKKKIKDQYAKIIIS